MINTAFISKGNRKRFKPRCYNCNQIGHFANKCKFPLKKKETENKQALLSIFAVNETKVHDEWYIDSGASSHMTNNMQIITNCSKLSTPKEVIMANNEKVPVNCKGTCNLDIIIDNKKATVTADVMYVPELSTNLLSVGQMAKNGKVIVFDDRQCRIFDKCNQLIATATLEKDMYKLDLDKSVCCSFGSVVKDNFELWHRRLGHMNVQYMKELQKSAGIGFVEPSDKNDVCVVCCKGKQSKS